MKKLKVWLPLLFSVVMIFGMFIGYRLHENINTKNFFSVRKLTRVQEVIDIVRTKYVDTINVDSLSDDAIQGIIAKLDPHSYFIPAAETVEMNEDLQGNFEGIGIEFQIYDDTVNVVNVLSNGPSDKAGIQVGDKFIKVNDSLVAGNHITGDRIKKLLRGPGSSKVTLTMLRGTTAKQVPVTRGTIPLPAVDAAYMLDRETGYIRINKFSRTTYPEFMQAMEKLTPLGIKKLVLDLRDNGGGMVDQAVNIADEFLDEGKLIVYTEGAKSPKEEYVTRKPGVFETGKLAVLVNEGTASASEILTGALQDWDRAVIIGRRTFGKGLVQQPFQLTDGSELRLTIARYYTPLGRSIQKPYTNGRESYNEEVMERFHDGEVVHGDTSNAHTGKVFITKAGHKVYGGGGITPDVFVAYDTSVFSRNILQLYAKGTVNNFVYRYYMDHFSTLHAFKTPADFISQFHQENDLWNSLQTFALRDSIDLKDVPEKERLEMSGRLRALIARLIWRTEGYYEVSNSHDAVVQKALETLK